MMFALPAVVLLAPVFVVMVGEPLSANEFYKQLGFKYLAQHSTHGHLANIYVMNVDIDY